MSRTTNKTAILRCRVTEEEKRYVEEASDAAGFTNVSDYLRAALLESTHAVVHGEGVRIFQGSAAPDTDAAVQATFERILEQINASLGEGADAQQAPADTEGPTANGPGESAAAADPGETSDSEPPDEAHGTTTVHAEEHHSHPEPEEAAAPLPPASPAVEPDEVEPAPSGPPDVGMRFCGGCGSIMDLLGCPVCGKRSGGVTEETLPGPVGPPPAQPGDPDPTLERRIRELVALGRTEAVARAEALAELRVGSRG